MRTVTIKINYANLKTEIEENYFYYLDLFYKAFVVNICTFDKTVKPVLFSTVIENAQYNLFLHEVKEARDRGEDIIELIDPKHNLHVFADMSIYTADFFNLKHNEKKPNIYNLTIDDHYNVVITNKQVGRNVY